MIHYQLFLTWRYKANKCVQRPAVFHLAVEHAKSKECSATFVASMFKLNLILRNTFQRCEPAPSWIDVRNVCESWERGKRYWDIEREGERGKMQNWCARILCVCQRERENKKKMQNWCAPISCVCVCMRERDLWTCECALLCSDYNGRYVHLIFVSITWNVFLSARRKNAASSIKVRYFFVLIQTMHNHRLSRADRKYRTLSTDAIISMRKNK